MWAMKLAEYADQNNLTVAGLADLLEEQYETVRLWVNGERMPRPKALRKISEKTNGQVQANDFVTGTEAA
jgi:hypothetical protein